MRDKQDIFKQLNHIYNASKAEQPKLIEHFKKTYPDEVHWLPVLESPATLSTSESYLPKIPAYKIIKAIGSGANGSVYLAHNDDEQAVAIKTPNVWLNDDQISRFKHEAQLLARLSHPNIAKVLDVGEFDTPQGKMPFIAMEFIDGLNIDQYVKQQHLSPRNIVDLFKPVLSAVQYAHQKSVIHRDIKPDNIIVDQQGTPKLLDFGIATLSTDATHAMTQLTKTGEIVGTLAYMSPEQISASPELDSRTDIYSCGVVLYQLVSGQLPFAVDARQFFSAINKILYEPPKNLTVANPHIQASLAAVIHHAIEKKPENRFQTAHDFYKDIEAWLNGKPIQSQQLSKWYWIKQAAQQHKALVTGTALAFIGLLTGLVFAISFALKEQQARAEAVQKSESNRQVVQFINDLFVNADPTETLGAAITVKQVIQGAQYTVDKDISDEPQVEAQIRLVLGNVFDAIQLFPSALSQYQKGLNRLEQQDELYFELATQKLEALANNTQFEQLMQAIEQLKIQLSHADLNESTINAINNKILFQKAKFYTANGKMNEALVVIKQLKQQNDLDTFQQFEVNKYRSHIHRQMGEAHQAEQLFRSEIDKAKTVFGESHPTTLGLIQELALTLQETNKINEALQLYDTLIKGMEQNYGENSASTLLAKMNKATTYMYAGDFEQADVMTAELLPKMIEHIGPMHQFTLTLRSIRGGVLENTGKLEEALVMYQETLDLFLQSESKDNYTTLIIPHNMAIVYNKLNNPEKANEVYQIYRPQCEATLSLEHPLCIIMADTHADILIQIGAYQLARELLAYSNPALLQKYGAEHYRVIASNARLKRLDKILGTNQ